jgi:hypothetical protein
MVARSSDLAFLFSAAFAHRDLSGIELENGLIRFISVTLKA